MKELEQFLVRAEALLARASALAASAHAEDWPSWGGKDPGRNMVANAKGLPETFEPGKLKPGTEEVDLATLHAGLGHGGKRRVIAIRIHDGENGRAGLVAFQLEWLKLFQVNLCFYFSIKIGFV